ncbi:MAG: 50S ribosomal protein L3 N(5)-glutamine methyltransferase [Hyphomicrobiaceae bacterium]|nr:50S ribosomal protein L3 N(5)-glutamine methyltransferase [Hyphomicrobiaceae bacterium]
MTDDTADRAGLVNEPIADLVTLRDWLRYGVSRFAAAGLVYGHGTESALDEAAFLILSSLSLPVDQLEPWLDARLTRDERRAIAALIDERIATRKPAPYLTGVAYIGPYSFRVDERVIVPRSYIGELLLEGLGTVVADPDGIGRVLDLCTGSGCLAILAALAFPSAAVDAADLSADALAVAADNVADYGLEDRIRLLRSDLWQGLDGERYDLIVTNPPYVTSAAVASFPPEYAAEPEMAHHGGEDGLDLVRAIIDGARRHLGTDGTLVVEIGQGREALEAAYPDIAFLWLDTAGSSGEVFCLSADQLPGEGGE